MATLNDIALAGGFTIQLPNPQDPNFEQVTLLLPGNGNNGQNNDTIIDNGGGSVASQGGIVGQGTFSPFSLTGWSTFFNGTTDRLSIANNAAFYFDSNNFTIEFFINFGAWTSAEGARGVLTKGWTNINAAPYLFYVDNSLNRFSLYMSSNGSTWDIANAVSIINTIPTLNIWYHIALSRQGNTFRIFVNGVQTNTVTSSASLFRAADHSISIGAGNAGAYYFNGFVSNLRMVNGTALYTSNFTAPTEPLTAVTNTVLLTCQQNRFMDSSSTNAAVTVPSVNAFPRIQSLSPFNPSTTYSAAVVGGSGEFDGVARLILSNYIFQNGPFTCECWFYKGDNASVNNSLFGSDSTFSAYWTQMFVRNNNYIGMVLGGNLVIDTPTSNLYSYQWNHIVFMKSLVGGTWTATIYVNGVKVASTPVLDYTVWIYRVGGLNNGASARGYISGVKINATGIYDQAPATIPVPTSPPVASGSNLYNLINFTNAQITDATSKNDVYTNNNVIISSAVSKWGGSSIFFDGLGDNLLVTGNPTLRLGSSDWTIEWWMYLTTVPGTTNDLMVFGTGAVASTSFAWYLTGAPNWEFYANDGNAFLPSPRSLLVANTWQYWAVVRSGRTLTCYLNGTSVSTANLPSTSSVLNGGITANLRIGGTGNSIPGYINDLRITKVARYTSNFPVPKTSFPTF